MEGVTNDKKFGEVVSFSYSKFKTKCLAMTRLTFLVSLLMRLLCLDNFKACLIDVFCIGRFVSGTIGITLWADQW